MPPKKVNVHKKALKWVGTIQDVGRKILGKEGSRLLGEKAVGALKAIPSFAKGGKVKKSGLIKAHKNEVVLPAKTVSALKKLLK
jgi:hypothetical protein